MSPYLHYEIARAHQQEIVSRVINSHRRDRTRPAGSRHRSIKYGVVQVAAALGVCLAAGTAVAVSDAQSNQRPDDAARRPCLGTTACSGDPHVRGQGLRADFVHREWNVDAQLQHRPVADSQVVAASPRAVSWGLGGLEGGAWPHRLRPRFHSLRDRPLVAVRRSP